MLAASKLVCLGVAASLVAVGALVAVSVGTTPGAGSDHGLDTDADGLYDWLVVSMDLKVDAANYYTVAAVLGTPTAPDHGCAGPGPGPMTGMPGIPPGPRGTPLLYPISWAVVRQFLEAGESTIILAFRGTDIALAGVDGPYTVEAFVSPDAAGGGMGGPGNGPTPGMPAPQGAPWTYTTGPYRASAFDLPRFAIRFTGEHEDRGLDPDGNGLFDSLALTAQVQVDLAGTYTYSASLAAPMPPAPPPNSRPDPWNQTWVPGVFTSGTVELAAGLQTIEARFDGGQIWATQYSGAFNFTFSVFYGGILYGQTNGTAGGRLPGGPPVPGNESYDLYGDTLCGTTGSYPHDAWDEPVPPAAFTGAFGDRGIDLNGDGTYDVLAVDAQVNVTEPTALTLAGDLSSGDGSRWITGARESAFLDAGVHNLTLSFPGPAIRASGIDGPYLAALSLETVAGPERATYTTHAYAATDFDAQGNGTRGNLWISNLTADASAIHVSVERTPDMKMIMMEGVVRVVAATPDGRTVFVGNGTVSVSSGEVVTLVFPWSPGPGTYAVRATLDSQFGTDAREIAVTI